MQQRLDSEFPKLRNDVGRPAVSNIRYVLFESQAPNAHLRALHWDVGVDQHLNESVGDVGSHPVIDTAPGQNYLRVVAELLRLGSQVVGIHADAVAPHQSRTEGKKIPFRSCRREHVPGPYAQALEYQ